MCIVVCVVLVATIVVCIGSVVSGIVVVARIVAISIARAYISWTMVFAHLPSARKQQIIRNVNGANACRCWHGHLVWGCIMGGIRVVGDGRA